jgi:hypothetical protein
MLKLRQLSKQLTRPNLIFQCWLEKTSIRHGARLDEAAAIMLAQLLGKHGISARTESARSLATPNVFRLEAAGVMMTCLCYVDTKSAAHMRYTIRRLRRKLQDAKIVLVCCPTSGPFKILALDCHDNG